MTAIEFVEFKIQRHTGLHRKHGIYDKKKPSNLHKNSLFSETYNDQDGKLQMILQ